MRIQLCLKNFPLHRDERGRISDSMVSAMTVLNCLFVAPGFDTHAVFMQPPPDERARKREDRRRRAATRNAYGSAKAAAGGGAEQEEDEETDEEGAEESDAEF